MKPSTIPRSSARAAMFRKAAEIIANDGEAHSCIAIYRAAGLGVPELWYDREPLPDCDKYDALFKPDNDEGWGTSWGICWGDERKDCRIVALCFMAAMVEAGDA